MSVPHNVSSFVSSLFHLRRLPPSKKEEATKEPQAPPPPPTKVVENTSTLILLDSSTTFGRNPEKCDVVLSSSAHSASNMISRDHAEITGQRNSSGRIERYHITDKSLNGTYINDQRVHGPTEIRIGDVIKFGHMNGAAVKPGVAAPQANAEFAFLVERANPLYSYLGFTDWHRTRPVTCTGDVDYCVESEQRQIPPRDPLRMKDDGKILHPSISQFVPHAASIHTMPMTSTVSEPFSLWSSLVNTMSGSQMPNYGGLPFAPYAINGQQWQLTGGFRPPDVANYGLPSSTASFAGLAGRTGFPIPMMNSLLNQTIASHGTVGGHNLQQEQQLHQHHLQQQHQRRLQEQQKQNHQQQVHQQSRPPVIENKTIPAPATVLARELLNANSTSLPPADPTPPNVSHKVPVASPPMECDSSVPSPPKSTISSTQLIIKQEPNIEIPEKRSEFTATESPPPPRAPAPAPWDSTPSPRPRDTPDIIEKEKTRKDTEKAPAKVASSAKHSRKSNEIGRLLTDLTEGSWANVVRRQSTSSSRRPTEDAIVEKNAKKEKKRQQKTKEKKKEEEQRQKEKVIRPITTVAAAAAVGFTSKPIVRRLKQLSDESSVSSDSDDEERIVTKPKKKGKAPLVKRKAKAALSESDDSADSDDDSEILKKKKTIKEKAPRGGKKTAIAKKKSKKAETDEEVEESEVTHHDPNQTCAMKSHCDRPQSDNVLWICCEDCDGWYHSYCILGTEAAPTEESFYCGCQDEKKKQEYAKLKKKRIAMANKKR